MPFRDGTGPLGKGPRTGRDLGPCGKPKEKAPFPARGRGLSRGLGRGLGRGR